MTTAGSTDNSAKEQETLFVRICSNGKIATSFLCIDQPKSTTAIDPLKFFLCKMSEYDIKKDFESKLVGFSADGASNMMGNRTGYRSHLLT